MGAGGKIVVHPGVTIRQTQNLDEDRDSANGAIAVVCDILVAFNEAEGRREYFYGSFDHRHYGNSASGYCK